MKEHIFEYDDMFTEPLGLPHFPKEEIVRCRDCKEFVFGNDEYATADWCYYWNSYVESPDGFCAWGERRE